MPSFRKAWAWMPGLVDVLLLSLLMFLFLSCCCFWCFFVVLYICFAICCAAVSARGHRPQSASNVQKWFAVLCYVMGGFCFCCCACFAVFLGIAGVVGRCFAVAWWCAVLGCGVIKKCDYRSLNENSNTASTCQKNIQIRSFFQRLQLKHQQNEELGFFPIPRRWSQRGIFLHLRIGVHLGQRCHQCFGRPAERTWRCRGGLYSVERTARPRPGDLRRLGLMKALGYKLFDLRLVGFASLSILMHKSWYPKLLVSIIIWWLDTKFVTWPRSVAEPAVRAVQLLPVTFDHESRVNCHKLGSGLV